MNGYNVFNGHRYSQATAYNQSVIHCRSAGSLILGATWYQSSFDYSNKHNNLFMAIGHGIHRIKVHQANHGIDHGFQAQFNNFNYKKDQCKVNIFDSYDRHTHWCPVFFKRNDRMGVITPTRSLQGAWKRCHNRRD